MKFINEILLKDSSYRELSAAIKNNRLPIVCTGLSLIHKAITAAALNEHVGKKIAVLTHSEASASELCRDISALGLKAVNFPLRDLVIGNVGGYSKEYEHKRINTLSELSDGAFDVLTVSVDAAIQPTIPPEVLKQSRITLKAEDTIDLKALTDNLTEIGYSRCEMCEGEGQFSLRGGILDVFAVGALSPCRIELWGDEIDSISFFDVQTQRRTDSINSLEILPAHEVIYNPKELSERLKTRLNGEKLSEKQKAVISRDIEALNAEIQILPDRYLPIIYGKATVFDYLNDTLLIISEQGSISERMRSIFSAQSADIEAYLEEGYLTNSTASLTIDKAELFAKLEHSVTEENFPRNSYEITPKSIINFDFRSSSPWSGDVKVLEEDLGYTLSTGGAAVILAGESRAARVLNNELCEKGINSIFTEKDNFTPTGVTVTTGGLSSGFEIPLARFMLVTHRHIAAEVKRRKRKSENSKEIGSLDELKAGDLVVHETHGIGIFEGINRIKSNGVTKDYIKIKYAGNDILYVPVTQLDIVSKYIGSAESGGFKLNRLGGTEWQKTRKRVKAAVRDMAKQLTALYAKRMSAKGYAFGPDTDLQNDFERRFEYDETDDQMRCINEIKQDMEKPQPMDRLLCGDVGFGKTEVALRAAFKCISEGKQCALLVPTTILAMQHYNTAVRRFGDMPVTVALLNRFVSKREQERIISDLKCGRLDMVIGTHRLISKDVTFKDIGLVIIDEEQRFGVAQKERLKEAYPFVDILTLSATPIPRTLNMAMSGLRDMSSIDEAPGDRHPVQSYVLEYNRGVLLDAINRELRRGGQVYYLHNRIETIEQCAAALKKYLPETNIGIAHGKMAEEELSDVWRSLVEHEIDILVCTTIIETGVDVPNANTLIIEEADRMGLSQLHQLRGRVGRSPRRAYAYFCFKPNRQLSEVAAKRLEAIREFTEFGSGFKIAVRDLEIRGAGSILGGDQHGNMESVGYDMYLKLLSQAVNEENGLPAEEETSCTVDLNVSAFIPESYIEALPARLGIYKRIAAICNEDDAGDVTDELCDRFGEPPKSVMGLIDISLLRRRAEKCGITEITGTNDTVKLKISSIQPEVMHRLSEKFGNRLRLSASEKPMYLIKASQNQKLQELVTELSKTL